MVHAFFVFIYFYLMKKLFLVSFFALLSLCVNAYDFEVGGIYYNITGGNTVEVTSGDMYNYKGDIVIPSSVMYDSQIYAVTNIRHSAFGMCSVTSVRIPEGVTSIGAGAFSQCTDLTSIVLPDGMISIGEDAFQNCFSLTSINIPASVRFIGRRAFFHCI